jgi:hypothetical protein
MFKIIVEGYYHDGARVAKDGSGNAYWWWWLRSLGCTNNSPVHVTEGGYVLVYGI